MDNTTIVFSSARAIRHAQLSQTNETLFLPHAITMSDFINTVCIVEGYSAIDTDTRTLLLLQASDFKNFEKLQIERNFFTFTKNSSYILSFFQELSSEECDMETLYEADTYAEYEEHIAILKELYNRYKKLCEDAQLLDTIFLPQKYKLNRGYLQSRKEIILYVDGYLTQFELHLLEDVSVLCKVTLHFTAGKFNTKMQNTLQELGFEIQKGYRYIVDFQTKTVVEKKPYATNTHVLCESVSEELLQVAFVKKKIYDYVEKGYDPQKIAVVLPNENRAKQLRSFDTKTNLNSAMGIPFSTTRLYKTLQATLEFLSDTDSQENQHRLKRVGESFYKEIAPYYYMTPKECDVGALLERLESCCVTKQEHTLFHKELYHFQKLLVYLQDLSLKSILNLFMQRLSQQNLDDTGGGKITVMGVLETRGISFDGVIIVDFNENNVPKRSQKDMFLNTQVRKHAGLPTPNDRENLQRHYYEMLINASKEVSICYVASPTQQASTFLKQLEIKQKNGVDENSYAEILFQKHTKKTPQEREIVLPYSFRFQTLSATKLKTFLTCKRRYYFNYIVGLKDFEIPKDMPKEYEIGSKVHAALKELYTHKQSYKSVEELQKDLWHYLDTYRGKTELESYMMGLQKKYLNAFCENEIQRFNAGWRVEGCEISKKREYQGVQITGQIDRIDTKENCISILDYKTGSYTLYNKNNVTQATDFQLEFYYLLAKEEQHTEINCGFYDLKKGCVVEEQFLEQKLSLLETHIKDLLALEEVDFHKCEDTKQCLYCPYKMMCGR